MQPTTAQQICTDALQELNAYDIADAIDSASLTWALSKFQRMLDSWLVVKSRIFAYDFLTFTLVTKTQPLLIGQAIKITSATVLANVATYQSKNKLAAGDVVNVTGFVVNAILNVVGGVVTAATNETFTIAIVTGNVTEAPVASLVFYSLPDAAQAVPPNFPTFSPRPIELYSANLLLTSSSPPARVQLRIIDENEWMSKPVPQVLSDVPTELYYNPKFPNGEIRLYPLQSSAYGLEMMVLNDLPAQILQTTVFALPPGYREAVTYELAIALGPSFSKPISADLRALS